MEFAIGTNAIFLQMTVAPHFHYDHPTYKGIFRKRSLQNSVAGEPNPADI
jgi:hypothetical protein